MAERKEKEQLIFKDALTRFGSDALVSIERPRFGRVSFFEIGKVSGFVEACTELECALRERSIERQRQSFRDSLITLSIVHDDKLKEAIAAHDARHELIIRGERLAFTLLSSAQPLWFEGNLRELAPILNLVPMTRDCNGPAKQLCKAVVRLDPPGALNGAVDHI